ncbi:MAG: molybdopterin-dependent oxidoreductase [Proteobacteria bacterium]|nr:molybdopterin-dependent oxidoreductase [Pseudomonadota bacterium]
MSEKKEIYSDCTLCYHTCGTIVTVEDKKAVKIKGSPVHPLNKGRLCPKGTRALDTIYHPERIKRPLKRVGSEFQEISWDQALTVICDKLLALKDEFGPEILGLFSGSIGVENLEMATMAQMIRSGFGSPNFFSVESICYRMRVRTRQMTFGRYPIEDPNSNLYILWGHNPDTSDFILKFFIRDNLKKGAKLVVIDPKRLKIADQAEMYLAIRPGTDGALALAMMHVIIKEDLYDHDFVMQYTHGFDELKKHVEQYTPEWAEEITEVPADQIVKLARLYCSIKGASIHQGICTQDQTANGTQNSRAFAVLQTITGNINIPGGWVLSPHPRLGNMGLGVSGEALGSDRYPLFVEMWEKKEPFGIVTTVPENIPDPLKAFLVVGGNPLLSMPDSKAFKAAFEKLDLLVVHDLFMTETAKIAHYVLPANSHLEKWGVSYNYNVCHCIPYLMLRKQCIEPLYESWSEFKLFKEMANRLGFGNMVPYETEQEYVQFLLASTGLTFDHLLNVKPEGDFYGEHDYRIRERTFATPSGKVELYSEFLEQSGFDPMPTFLAPEQGPMRAGKEFLKKYPLTLSIGNRNYYFTHTQHRNINKLIDRHPEPLTELGVITAEKYGISDGDFVTVNTKTGSTSMKASVSDKIMEGVVLVPHGWDGDANGNLLTDINCREPMMGYPDQKSLQCNITKMEAVQP